MPLLEAPTQTVLRNILFATDFSVSSQKALPYAGIIARRYGARLVTIHVDSTDKTSEGAAGKMRELAASLEGIKHEEVFRSGEPWTAIAAEVKSQAIDLLIVGSEGRTGLSQIAGGSMAEEILRRASCPVFVVGPNAPADMAKEVSIHHILYACDFSEAARSAAPYAISLAHRYQAHLTMLYVAEQPAGATPAEHNDFMAYSNKALQEVIPPDEQLAVRPEFIFKTGVPAAEILKVAREKSAALIVLGIRSVHQNSELTHLGRSTAVELIAEANCPVMTVGA